MNTSSYITNTTEWAIAPGQTTDVPTYECGTLVHALAICNLARDNMDDLLPYVTLPSWAVCKVLDALEHEKALLKPKCEGVLEGKVY